MTMKKTVLIAVAFVLTLTACVGDHKGFQLGPKRAEPTQKRTVRVDGFEQIELRGAATVVYRQADSVSVVVEATAEQLENVYVSVKDGVLNVADKQSRTLGLAIGSRADGVRVYVTSPDLIGVTLSGSGDFVGQGLLDSDRLRLQLKGSGDVELADIICDELTAEVVGSGDMDLKHVVAQRADLSLVGSGDLDVRLENVASTSVSLLGSGDVEVHFAGCGTANCQLRGSGDIELKGNLEHLSQQKSGSGDIDTDKLTLKK